MIALSQDAIGLCEYNCKVDIWSFGIMLFQLLCPPGTTPYAEVPRFELLTRISQDGLRPKWPDEVQVGEFERHAATLNLIYLECTARLPTQRPDASILITQLESLRL